MNTPFVDYKATELTIEKLKSFFVCPKYIDRLCTNKASHIIGGRGTGKTTILKYLANKYNEFDHSLQKKKLGVYYKFEINRMSSFSGDCLDSAAWEKLFAHTMSIILCIELTNILIVQKEYYLIRDERNICQRVLRRFFVSDLENVYTFESLLLFLEKQESIASFYKRNPKHTHFPIICDYGVVIEEYCEQLAKDDLYKDICIHFLFDEFENLMEYQQIFFNTLLKNSSPFYTYKICIRPNGVKNYKTMYSEYIRATDDYEELDYCKDIIGTGTDEKKFIEDMCKKRLEEYFTKNNIKYIESDLLIDDYFPNIDDDVRLSILSKKKKYVEALRKEVSGILNELMTDIYRDILINLDLLDLRLLVVLINKQKANASNFLKSIVARDEKYHNWIHNYKRAIVILCCLECQSQYLYGGLDDIIQISGGTVRYVLEICDAAFSLVNFDKKNGPIRVDFLTQTAAIRKVSELRFHQITTVPDVGYQLQQLVDNVGKIFSYYHKDPSLAKFEPNHFSLHQKFSDPRDNAPIIRTLNTAITWGIFLTEKTTKEKNNHSSTIGDIDYILHPIYTPYFQISARKKQKCCFSYEEIFNLTFGDNKKSSAILHTYANKIFEKKSKKQIDIFEVLHDDL